MKFSCLKTFTIELCTYVNFSAAGVARLACCALANLAEMSENFDRIADANAIPNLISVLSNPNEDLRKDAARALGNLAANIEFGDVILREGALPYLIPMLRSSDSVTQRMAAMALCNLSSNIRNQGFMLDGGLFDPLMGEGKFLLIYICNFHIFKSHLHMNYICKLHWNY